MSLPSGGEPPSRVAYSRLTMPHFSMVASRAEAPALLMPLLVKLEKKIVATPTDSTVRQST